MNQLYPLKFNPIYKEKIWGGENLKAELNRTDAPALCGESWEISAVQDNVSVVSNGFLKGNDLQELIEVYMDELVGEKVYEKFGMEFPLLIKFIDASDVLSVQVHPDDQIAKERHQAYGKTEMWYVAKAEEGASLITGFKEDSSKEEFLSHLESGKLLEILNQEKVQKGDVFFLPAGRIHAIGKGIMLAEIQQTSDITYRVYDWDRVDKEGKQRDLHLDLALDVIDYKKRDDYRAKYQPNLNKSINLATCDYFTTNLINFEEKFKREYYKIDSFVVYMCQEGSFTIKYEGGKEKISKGETILIPAALKEIQLETSSIASLLEIFIG